MNEMPEITVLMPVYNAEQYLREAIESILNQSFADFEFLIIDDGSIDGSVELIQTYRDPRIRFYQNEKNSGIAFTLNRGLEMATGKYIARMDADDVAFPTRLEEQDRFMEQHPKVVLSGAFAEKIGAQGEHIDLIRVPEDNESLRIMLLFGNCFIHPLATFNRLSALAAGGYSEKDHDAEDYGLWAKLAGSGELANLNKVLLKYRWSGKNISAKNHSLQQSTAFTISYSAINASIGRDLPQDAYRQFWYFWKLQEGFLDRKSVNELLPLWDFVAGLPGADRLLAVPWGRVALRMLRSGNTLAGLLLLMILKRKLNYDPGWKGNMCALMRGILRPVK
jgi:hypothetical protein